MLLPGFGPKCMQYTRVVLIHLFPSIPRCNYSFVLTRLHSLDKFPFYVTKISDFYVIYCLIIAFHAFIMHILASVSVDEILLQRYVNCSSNFRGLPV